MNDTTMAVVARYKGWEIVYNLNSLLSIHHENGAWLCDFASVRDAVVHEVKDMEIRKELMRQWAEYADRQNQGGR